MNNQKKLFKQGLTPVWKSNPVKPNWQKMDCFCQFDHFEDDEGTELDNILTFKFTFSEWNQLQIDHTISIAYCFPFSYEECQQMLHVYESKFKHCKEIYFHRELLVKSVEGKRVDLLTITSPSNVSSNSLEPVFKDSQNNIDKYCFPNQSNVENRTVHCTTKPIYIVSARVHSGETPSSFICNGFLKFILDLEDPRAILLREHFVFLVIPILNPDGVFMGNYRTDSLGQNLNRFYSQPDPLKQPTIYATKKLLLYYAKRIVLYVDLHAHAQKQNAFIYGNYIPNVESQVSNILFAKLVALNCQHLDFNACNFSESNMNHVDKRDGLSKEGTGRVAIFTETGIIGCYTLEVNYHTGKTISSLAKPMLQHLKSKTEKGVSKIEKSMPYYSKIPTYTIQQFEEIGQALAVAGLDYLNANPYSRIPNTSYKTISAVKNWILSKVKIAPKCDFSSKKKFK